MGQTPEEIREMEHMHIKMSYNKIEELIYAGNNICCQGHFDEELLSKGITTDVSLEAENLDNPQGVKYFFWFPWSRRHSSGQMFKLRTVLIICLFNTVRKPAR